MSENIRYILTLAVICFLTASLLTGVYLLTKDKIFEQKEEERKQALEDVLPDAGYFEPVHRDQQIIYYRAYASDRKERLLGYAFEAQGQGYSGIIESICGMDTQGRITGVRILSQNETPGLGAKINEVLAKETLWQAIKGMFAQRPKPEEIPNEPWFCAQFKGKKITDLIVAHPERNIHAITGATISSQALTDSVREKAEEILGYER